MCEIILSAFIVGAMEVAPGTMAVNIVERYDGPDERIVRTVHMPTPDYLDCWGNAYP